MVDYELLQADGVYGGLNAAGEYDFVYFPTESTRSKWHLLLRRDQINAIAAGRILELTLWTCVDPSCGGRFADPIALCFYCDYIDDEPKTTIPRGEFRSKEEWAIAYFSLNRNAHPLQMIGDYNSDARLGECLGFFSLDEAGRLQAEPEKGDS